MILIGGTMKNILKVGFSIGVFVLTGCATPQRINTASGRPEVTIHAPKKSLIDRIANGYSRSGYQIKTVNDYSIVAERPSQSTAAALLLGSNFTRTPNERVTVSFSEVPEGTLIQARVEMVTNPGSGYENVTDFSGGAVQLQNQLEQLKASVETPAASPTAPKTPTTPPVAPAAHDGVL